MLITMIKNESKILKRMVDSALPILDAICILDTGSTDNTVDIANEIINASGIQGKIFSEKFVDFGTSRTKSFTCAKQFLSELGWDETDTYGLLLDADMKLIVSNVFTKKMLGQYDSYSLRQDNCTSYYNIRLIRMSLSWVCKGKTHEYWCVTDNMESTKAIVEDEDLIWIDDVSDGGCKDDKFERDERLLLQGIEEEPELQSRYYFYLAQTYSSMNRYEDAIKYYKKRIDVGGWTEEVWFSHCMICRSYIEMSFKEEGKYEAEIEHWANKAYELYNARSDAFYLTALYFYKRGNLEKCQEYIDKGKDTPLPKREILFVDNLLYTRGYKSLQFKVYVDRKDKRCIEHGIELMNTMTDVKKNILNTIVPFFDSILISTAVELQIPINCYNLSLYWDKESKTYSYLEDNTITLLDQEFNPIEKSKKNVPFKHAYFFDKDTFVIPSQKLVLHRNTPPTQYKGICYIGNTFESMLSLYPFVISEKIVPVKKEFLEWFKPSLSTSYNNKTYTLLYSGMEFENNKLTIYCVISIENGSIKFISSPFSIENSVSAICAFTMIDETKVALIIYKDKKFYRTTKTL